MSLLITGATGLLGHHTLKVLHERAPELDIVGLTRRGGDLAGVRFIEGAVERPHDWGGHPALDGVEVIVHLAAQVVHSRHNAESLQAINVGGTLAMVELAARLGARLVFVSTSGTVGVFDTPDAWADEQSPHVWSRVRRWPYYASKVMAEQQAMAKAQELGVELVVVRPPILLGPEDPTGRSIRHVTRVLDGKLPALVQGGIHWVDVRSAAEAVATLALTDAPPPIVHLPGTQWSLPEFVERVAAWGGVRPPRWVLPWRVVHTASRLTHRIGVSAGLPDPVLIEMAHHWWGLRTRHAEAIGWNPPDGETTLRDTIEWARR